MTALPVETPVFRHLFWVEGDTADIDAFLLRANGEGRPLSLKQLIPPPQDLIEVDPLDLAHFHLLHGSAAEARSIFEDLQEPWPFPDTEDNSRTLRQYLRNHPEVSLNAQRVQKNLVRHGVLTHRAWRQTHWGAATDIEAVALHRVGPERVHFEVVEAVSRKEAFYRIARLNPTLSMGCLYVDEAALKQGWFFRFAGDTTFSAEEEALTADDLVFNKTVLHEPPHIFVAPA